MGPGVFGRHPGTLYTEGRPTVMYYLQSLCSPSLDLMKEIRAVFYLLESPRIVLELECIRSEDNVILDHLSWQANNDDQKLQLGLYCHF